MRDEFESGLERQYHPCTTGIHVCSIDDDAGHEYGPHVTLLNITIPKSRVRSVFDAARAEFEEPGNDADLSVDLQIDDNLVDNFFMWRQMLARLQDFVSAQGVLL